MASKSPMLPKADTKENLRYVLGLLNSKLMTFRFRGLGKLTSPNMWESFHNSIEDFPIRRIDFENSSEVALHDRVVELVTQLEGLMPEVHEGLSAADRSLAARRAEALRDQLDEQVLDLYGIGDGEQRASVLALGAPFESPPP
jgi:hypothetical protein